jgi:localization factor PodJL
MNGSRSTPTRPGERSSLDALSRTIEGLEARIEGLVGSAGRDVRQRAGDLQRESLSSRYGERADRPDPLAEIRERQRMLEESRNRALAGAARPPVPTPPREDSLRRETERRLSDAYRPREPRPAPTNDAALREIAQTLVSLREDLTRDINDGVSRQVDALRREMRDLKTHAGDGMTGSEDLRAELARLGESIDLLGHQARSRADTRDLKAEFEDLRSLMDGLAREDSLRHMERRWSDFEERVADMDPQPLREEIVSVAYRLDEIKGQLGALNPNPAIRAMEERLLAVAQAMEQLGRHVQPNDHLIAEQFAGLDLRLDEISRAIAAGSRANQTQEPELLNRLDRRIAALADQIGTISEENGRRPDAALELAGRIEALTNRVAELAAADPGVEAAARLEERLDQLSRLLERNQKAPPAPELTGFLSDISRKIEALDNSAVNDHLAERLEYLARRIDEFDHPPQPTRVEEDPALQRLESRLSDIARRLDEAAAGPAQGGRALESLESQIANLASLINRPQTAVAAMPPELEDRMASIEQYMATNDEYIIEAARQAAEAVVDAYHRNPAPAAVDLSQLAALAGDLRHLEELALGSEERTHRTFEALHDTLVQIAGRLDSMDQRLDERPAQGFAAEHRGPLRQEAPAPRPAALQAAPTTEGTVRGSFQQQTTIRIQPQPQPQPQAQPAPQPVAATSAPVFAEAPMPEVGEDDFDLTRTEHFNFSGPVIRTLEPEVAEAVQEAAREFVAAPQEQPAPKVKSGFLNTLTSRFRRKGKAEGARKEPTGTDGRAVVDPAPPIAPGDELLPPMETELLEPGSGAPDIKKILERVRANQSRPNLTTEAERADLIAAARRAAQAAAQEMRTGSSKPVQDKDYLAKAKGKAASDASGSVISRHRRPILMAVGAILLAIMTMPLVNTFLNGSEAPPPIEAAVPVDAQEAAADVTPPVPAPAEAEAGAPEAAAPVLPAAPASAEPEPVADAAPEAQPLPAAPAAPAEAQAPEAPAAPALTTPATAGGAQQLEQAPAPAPEAAAPAAAAPEATAITVPAGIEPPALADAARAGDPLALFEIGARFTEGRGVTIDLAEAARWYQLSADKDFAPAQYRIANLYEKGTGVARDIAKARDYYERAARAGNASAMHNLAVLFATGIDGKPDTAAAVNWFKQAADLGISDSQFNLAILYARGNGIPQDLEESYKWFAIAAKGGDKDAAQKRDDVANAMRPEQLQSARSKVELWKAKPVDPRANATEVPDSWAGKGTKTATVDMKKAIRNIQAILNNNGFDAGAPDGEMGAKTVAAIKAFQKSADMEADGRITDRLVKELLARNK